MTDIRALIDAADGALDEETYEQKRKDNFDPPDDAEYTVTVGTIRKINDVFQGLDGRRFYEWKPIEDGPKDGQRVLLFVPPYGAGSGNYAVSLECWNAHFCLNPEAQPTHWMPLPAPPAKATP